MINGIGNRRRCSDVGNFADALVPERIDDGVRLRHQDHFDGFDIGVDRHKIIGKIIVEVAALARIDFGRFVQSRADAPDHAAYELTAGCAGIDDVTGGKCPGDPWHPDFLGARVNANLDKFGAE
jgi:hypothetical protein